MLKLRLRLPQFGLLRLLAVTATLCGSALSAAEPDFLADEPPAGAFAAADYDSSPPDFVTVDAAAQLEARIAQLEAELYRQRSPLLGSAAPTVPAFAVQNDGDEGMLFGSVEVTFLRPRVSNASPLFSTGPQGGLVNPAFDAGVRYVLGYRGANGLGIRGRYWSFDHPYTYQPPATGFPMSIDTQAADLEFTRLQQFCSWDLEASSGIRYGKLRYYSPGNGAFGTGQVYFEGLGPTVSMAADNSLGNSGFSVFGNLRGSILFGEVRSRSLLLTMPTGQIRNEVMSIVENQLGFAYTHAIGSTGEFQVRTAWETQYWMNNSLANDNFGIGSNLGFMGPTIAVELRY